ncbi:MAG: hypothetical protein ACI4DO_09150, partial [Roseburia sp.]
IRGKTEKPGYPRKIKLHLRESPITKIRPQQFPAQRPDKPQFAGAWAPSQLYENINTVYPDLPNDTVERYFSPIIATETFWGRENKEKSNEFLPY